MSRRQFQTAEHSKKKEDTCTQEKVKSMKINPEMVHILELADKGYKTITIIKLKDIKENILVMNGKKGSISR